MKLLTLGKLVLLVRGELLAIGKLFRQALQQQGEAREEAKREIGALRDAVLAQPPPVVTVAPPEVHVAAAQISVSVPPFEVPEPQVTVNVPRFEFPAAELARMMPKPAEFPRQMAVTLGDAVAVERIDEVIEAIQKIDPLAKVTRKKPVPVLLVDEGGRPYVAQGGGGGGFFVGAQNEPMYGYRVSDTDAGETTYVGYQHDGGAWAIARITATAIRYVRGGSDYVAAWTARASQSYGYYAEVF